MNVSKLIKIFTLLCQILVTVFAMNLFWVGMQYGNAHSSAFESECQIDDCKIINNENQKTFIFITIKQNVNITNEASASNYGMSLLINANPEISKITAQSMFEYYNSTRIQPCKLMYDYYRATWRVLKFGNPEIYAWGWRRQDCIENCDRDPNEGPALICRILGGFFIMLVIIDYVREQKEQLTFLMENSSMEDEYNNMIQDSLMIDNWSDNHHLRVISTLRKLNKGQ